MQILLTTNSLPCRWYSCEIVKSCTIKALPLTSQPRHPSLVSLAPVTQAPAFRPSPPTPRATPTPRPADAGRNGQHPMPATCPHRACTCHRTSQLTTAPRAATDSTRAHQEKHTCKSRVEMPEGVGWHSRPPKARALLPHLLLGQAVQFKSIFPPVGPTRTCGKSKGKRWPSGFLP